MVRLKDRYLLVNIVYTDLPAGQSKGPVSDLLLYNQPSSGELKPQHILRAIRAEVNALFGDCGSGAIERSLQGKPFHLSTSQQSTDTYQSSTSRKRHQLSF